VGVRWTKHEDGLLSESVALLGEDWPRIAASVFASKRTPDQVRRRFHTVVQTGLVKGHWTADEDRVIVDCINRGITKWSEIASYIPGRIGKQCRERWSNHLAPTLNRSPFSPEEDAILENAVAKLGTRWIEVARRLPGRSENACKNRFNSTMRRRANALRAAARSAGVPLPGAASAAAASAAAAAGAGGAAVVDQLMQAFRDAGVPVPDLPELRPAGSRSDNGSPVAAAEAAPSLLSTPTPGTAGQKRRRRPDSSGSGVSSGGLQTASQPHSLSHTQQQPQRRRRRVLGREDEAADLPSFAAAADTEAMPTGRRSGSRMIHRPVLAGGSGHGRRAGSRGEASGYGSDRSSASEGSLGEGTDGGLAVTIGGADAGYDEGEGDEYEDDGGVRDTPTKPQLEVSHPLSASGRGYRTGKPPTAPATPAEAALLLPSSDYVPSEYAAAEYATADLGAGRKRRRTPVPATRNRPPPAGTAGRNTLGSGGSGDGVGPGFRSRHSPTLFSELAGPRIAPATADRPGSRAASAMSTGSRGRSFRFTEDGIETDEELEREREREEGQGQGDSGPLTTDATEEAEATAGSALPAGVASPARPFKSARGAFARSVKPVARYAESAAFAPAVAVAVTGGAGRPQLFVRRVGAGAVEEGDPDIATTEGHPSSPQFPSAIPGLSPIVRAARLVRGERDSSSFHPSVGSTPCPSRSPPRVASHGSDVGDAVDAGKRMLDRHPGRAFLTRSDSVGSVISVGPAAAVLGSLGALSGGNGSAFATGVTQAGAASSSATEANTTPSGVADSVSALLAMAQFSAPQGAAGEMASASASQPSAGGSASGEPQTIMILRARSSSEGSVSSVFPPDAGFLPPHLAASATEPYSKLGTAPDHQTMA
jgi:hypothetical protein